MTAPADLRQRLNTETARIAWYELERHYARGAVVTVDPDLDLIDVAARMIEDETASVQGWLEEDRMRRTTTEEARHWHREGAELWCVVVAPWVLVQAPAPS